MSLFVHCIWSLPPPPPHIIIINTTAAVVTATTIKTQTCNLYSLFRSRNSVLLFSRHSNFAFEMRAVRSMVSHGSEILPSPFLFYSIVKNRTAAALCNTKCCCGIGKCNAITIGNRLVFNSNTVVSRRVHKRLSKLDQNCVEIRPLGVIGIAIIDHTSLETFIITSYRWLCILSATSIWPGVQSYWKRNGPIHKVFHRIQRGKKQQWNSWPFGKWVKWAEWAHRMARWDNNNNGDQRTKADS